MCGTYTSIYKFCVLILVAIYILYVMKCVFNTHGVHMPKHIVSGLKYLTAVELIREGYSQKEVAKILDMDRSTVSHYLNGRNLSWNSIEIAEKITEFCPKDFLILTYALMQEKARIVVKTCSNSEYEGIVKESCIGCGLCVDVCLMKAIVLNDLKAQIDSDWCCGCLICGESCPTNSIEILEVKNDF
jgi:4Fe-4S ferredoxin